MSHRGQTCSTHCSTSNRYDSGDTFRLLSHRTLKGPDGSFRTRLDSARLRHRRFGGRTPHPLRFPAFGADCHGPRGRPPRAPGGSRSHRFGTLPGHVHRTSALQRGARIEQARPVEQPPFYPVACHRAGGDYRARRGPRPERDGAHHPARSRLRLRRRARPHRRRRRGRLGCVGEPEQAPEDPAFGRIAHQRRIGRRLLPVRHRGSRDRRFFRRRRRHHLPRALLRRHRLRRGRGLRGLPPHQPAPAPRIRKQHRPRALRGLHPLRRLPRCRRAARERHPGRGGRRPRDGPPHATPHHHLAGPAQPGVERLLGNHRLPDQRRRVRAAGHAASPSDVARRQRRIRPRSPDRGHCGGHFPRDARALRLARGDRARPSPQGRQRRASHHPTASERRPGHDHRRPQRRRHALDYLHDSAHRCGRRRLPRTQLHHLGDRRRNLAHPDHRRPRAAPPRAERASGRFGRGRQARRGYRPAQHDRGNRIEDRRGQAPRIRARYPRGAGQLSHAAHARPARPGRLRGRHGPTRPRNARGAAAPRQRARKRDPRAHVREVSRPLLCPAHEHPLFSGLLRTRQARRPDRRGPERQAASPAPPHQPRTRFQRASRAHVLPDLSVRHRARARRDRLPGRLCENRRRAHRQSRPHPHR